MIGKERLDEIAYPELAMERAVREYNTAAWSCKKVREYKELKGLHKENLRDNMTNTELVLNQLSEISTTEISKATNPKGMNQTIKVAQQGSLFRFRTYPTRS